MKKTNKISLVIIITFSIMIAMSVVTSTEQVMLLMGDTKCNITGEYHYGSNTYVSEHWHYGWSHWLYIIMGCCLAGVQVFNIITIVDETSES